MRCDTDLKRTFYETQAMLNNWNVDELGRAISSMLFERTGLSTDKAAVLEKHRSGSGLDIADYLKNPMVLDFLGLSEKASYLALKLIGENKARHARDRELGLERFLKIRRIFPVPTYRRQAVRVPPNPSNP